MAAIHSHVKLFDYIESEYGITCDVFISTYDTPYTSDVLNAYGSRVVGCSFIPHTINASFWTQHWLRFKASDTYTTMADNTYNFFMFIRIDIFIKEFFKTVFNPHSRNITFTSICLFEWDVYKNLHFHDECGSPRNADLIMFVPRDLIKTILVDNDIMPIHHDAWRKVRLMCGVSPDRIATFVDTFHDSDTAKDWNPIYRIVNRPESHTWSTPNFTFDRTKLGKAIAVPTNNESIYAQLIESDQDYYLMNCNF